MQIGMIAGVTRVIGRSQGYMGLPLKDIIYDDGTPAMESAWFPTPKELEALMAGAPVILEVLGEGHPPVKLSVGDTPDDPPPHPRSNPMKITDEAVEAAQSDYDAAIRSTLSTPDDGRGE